MFQPSVNCVASHRILKRIGVSALVLWTFSGFSQASLRAFAGTPVERGDVLYVSVSGAPEMTRDAKVDADGRIRLPLLGGIDVAGADVDEIQRRIETALVARDIVLSPVVLVEVSTYRPVYVGGAVRTSGEAPFQPGLTVRQAIIAAGGLSLVPGDKTADVGQVMELLARRQATEQSLTQSDSEIARLKAQLAPYALSPQGQPGPVQPPAAPAQDVPPRPSQAGLDRPAAKAPDAGDFASVDQDLLGALDVQRQSRRAYAETAVTLVQLELDVLTQQSELQKKERDLQHKEVESTRVMVDKGLVPLPRLTDLQREESRISRDLLENFAFAARARQDIERIRQDTAAADAEARIKVLEEYRKALQDHAALQAELDIIDGHLLAVGQVSTAKDGISDAEPLLVIHRRVAGASSELTVTMETDLQPGDVLDVKLPDLPRD